MRWTNYRIITKMIWLLVILSDIMKKIHTFASECKEVYIEWGKIVRILGIDPGIAIVGFGFIDQVGSKLTPVQYGCIRTEANSDPALRLKQIYEATCQLIDKYKPNAVAIEKLFFNRNVTTALTVGQARGVLMLAAVQKDVAIAEYTPLQVKQAVVGYGNAEKHQVQDMVKLLLNLREIPKPDDVADALAIAICHAHAAPLTQLVKEGYRS